MSNRPTIPITLHPRQTLAFTSLANEIFYGGAAGGGKSFLLRIVLMVWCDEIPGLQCYLFRRLHPDLIKTHLEGPKGFRNLLSDAVNHKQVFVVPEEIRFKNGSRIFLCSCKDGFKDVQKYKSTEMHVAAIDELTSFDEMTYRFIRSRVRASGIKIPEKYYFEDEEGKRLCMFPRIISGSNPSDIGHAWVKKTFIEGHIPEEVYKTPKEEGGMRRQFIPAKLEDNPSLTEEDPEYEGRLYGLGSEALVKAFRFGNWDIIAGAFFPEFNYDKHVIPPLAMQAHWTRFTAFDWGSADPFCVLWFAVSDGVEIDQDGKHNQSRFPRGTLIVYREWYGYTGEANKGLKLPNHEIAKGIVEREAFDSKISYRVAGHDIWIKKGGPSIAEDMEWLDFERKKKSRLVFDHANIDRINGHAQVRTRLVGDENGPGILIFNTCLNLIRTLPTLQHDPKKMEDIMDHMEDHAYDGLRYGCMSRPYHKTPPTPLEILGLKKLTMDKIWKETRNQSKYIY